MNPAKFGSAALAICFCLTLALPQTGASWLDNEYADVEVTTPDGPRTLSLRPVDDTQLAGTALAIDNEGCLFVWGYRGTGLGGEGELEVKSNQPANRVCLEGLEIEDATAAAGTFTTDGSSLYGQRESDDDRVGIAALASDGTVWTWGCFKGELCGRSLNTIGKATPGKAEIPLGEGEIVVDLKSATGIFLALTNLGNLYTWGDARAGDFAYPLGQGDAESSDRPVRILTKVHSFGSGPYAAWAVVADGWATVRDLTEPAANTRQAGIVFWGTQSVGYQTCAAANGYTTAKVRVPVAIDGKLKTLLDQGTAVGDENTKLGVKLGSSDDKGTFRQMTGTAYGNQFVLKNGDVLLWGDADNSGSGTYNHVDTASCSDAPEVTQIVDSNLDSKPKRPIVSVTNGDGWVLLLDATGQAHWYGKRSLAHMLPDKDGNPISTNGGYDFDDPQQITGSNGKMSGGWKWGCSEAWVEGGIEKLTGFGSSVMIKRTNGNFYIAGGSVSGHPGNNEHRIVRDSLQGTTYYSDQYATLVAQPVVP